MELAPEDPVVESEATSDFRPEAPVELDDLELPTFDEDDALLDEQIVDEQVADEELAPEAPTVESEVTPDFEPEAPVELDELELPTFDEDDALLDEELPPMEELNELQSDGVDDSKAVLEDFELPEFGELEALDSTNVESGADTSSLSDEQDALFDVFQSSSSEELAHQEFDEESFNELLDESSDADQAGFAFDGQIDTQTSDSAGMDIDAMLEMGGEDWNGFSLSEEQQASISDEIPADEQSVWDSSNAPEQATVDDENWEQQDELPSFDPQSNQYRTIDELMAEVEQEEVKPLTPEEEELKLDVGLNEFPDVIGDIGDTDVDSNAEAAGKLDLAKIYMEMNDSSGAKKLLEEAIVDGSDEIRREAKNLIDLINSQS
ncbi:FimV/HubP family polar landmark protein [Vibrio mexicanus]|uniref:FimV/HubP family polar landmark protein n=1 Tax=Vibrio mexicanus TaxID=1004326 RepID=UPI00069B2D58|nr:FimV/HubP family polar landmark protein [Vibrio mexicanus]